MTKRRVGPTLVVNEAPKEGEELGIVPSKIESYCFVLGPLRNLSTMTAAMLFFHKNCHAVNHGWPMPADRVFMLSWLSDYSENSFESFLRFGMDRSKFYRPHSMPRSHAFDRSRVRRAYADAVAAWQGVDATDLLNRHGNNLEKSYEDIFCHQKDAVTCLIWKEPSRLTDWIRGRAVSFRDLFERNDKVRFLLPVRNVLDCAYANVKQYGRKIYGNEGWESRYPLLGEFTARGFMAWTISVLKPFVCLRERYPDNFFYFFEDDFGPTLLENLKSFLKLEDDPGWLETCEKGFELEKADYEREKSDIELYERLVNSNFGKEDHPEIRDRLLSFI